jgi:hypothetical protein
MWGSWLDFLPTAFRLFFPLFLLIFGIAFLFAIRKPTGPVWATYLSALTCCLLYSADQFIRHGVTLRVPYHSSYMLVPIFGLAGALLGELWNRARGIATAIALAAAVLALPVLWNRFHPAYVSPRQAWTWLTVMAVAGIGLAILSRWPGLPIRDAACILLIFAGFLSTGMDQGLQYIWAPPQVWHGSNLDNGPHAEVFRGLMEFQDEIKTLDPARRLLFWWDQTDPERPLLASAAALNMSGFTDFQKELGSGSRADLEQLIFPDVTFVHLTSDPDLVQQHTQLLASRGILVGPERRIRIRTGAKEIFASLQDISDMSRMH